MTDRTKDSSWVGIAAHASNAASPVMEGRPRSLSSTQGRSPGVAWSASKRACIRVEAGPHSQTPTTPPSSLIPHHGGCAREPEAKLSLPLLRTLFIPERRIEAPKVRTGGRNVLPAFSAASILAGYVNMSQRPSQAPRNKRAAARVRCPISTGIRVLLRWEGHSIHQLPC